jgi:hypothetical protein
MIDDSSRIVPVILQKGTYVGVHEQVFRIAEKGSQEFP